MATAYTRKKKRQREESKLVRSNKHPLRGSMFGEVFKTKEYEIY